MKFSYWLLVISILVIFSGCEKKEEKKEVAAKPSQIKITEGVVKEKKAQEKEVDKGQFYYSYKEAKKEEIEDEGKYTRLGAYRHVLNNYQKVQISLLANKLSKDFLIYCSACHDDYANGIIGPSLLDKSGDYIYKQLQDFKSGKRKNVLMVQLVRRLDDKKLKALADEIAEFNKKVKKIKENLKDKK
ncbi:c-type cytochrome [Nitrosophilus kaiyonis]|uniref:c-type cytochrome n=1 Tax=Nitrosophilus kaiyonis TaxID=2930200 RepID=UPI002493C822|nr:hypothetical protein [Nitrosophilus kaiyonis]